jgi:hypothetical protein
VARQAEGGLMPVVAAALLVTAVTVAPALDRPSAAQ